MVRKVSGSFVAEERAQAKREQVSDDKSDIYIYVYIIYYTYYIYIIYICSDMMS